MKELLMEIVKVLVDYPNDICINEVVSQDGFITLEITVNDSDVGKIIGKQGRIAKAIRTVIKSVAIKQNKRVSVEIMQ